MKTASFLVPLLCVAIGLNAVDQASAVQVTLDFESAPVGVITSALPLIIPDGVGGSFTLTADATAGTTYEIVDKSGDNELRVTDQGGVTGSLGLDITHSEGEFTQISGGDYEALAGFDDGLFKYCRAYTTIFSVSSLIPTTPDNAISFDPQSEVLFARLAGNGSYSRNSDIKVDVDNLVFDVAFVPEPSSAILAILGVLGMAVLMWHRRAR